jgi:hypothetical protein
MRGAWVRALTGRAGTRGSVRCEDGERISYDLRCHGRPLRSSCEDEKEAMRVAIALD